MGGRLETTALGSASNGCQLSKPAVASVAESTKLLLLQAVSHDAKH